MLVITDQFLLETVCNPLPLIPNKLRVRVTNTVRRASLLLDCSLCCAPVLTVVSVNFFASMRRSVSLQALIVSDAVSEPAIPYEVKCGDVVTTPRASGFGVVIVE